MEQQDQSQQSDTQKDVRAVAAGTYGRSIRTMAEGSGSGIAMGAVLGLIVGVLFKQNALVLAGLGAGIGFMVSRAGKK